MPLSILDIADIGLGLAKVYRSENWNAGRIREYQERLLVEQLRYAVTHIPYYRDLGITAGQIVDMDSLHLFPTLDKSVIQQEGDRLCNQALLARGALSSQTSGSSGQPTVTWFDRRCWNFCKYALKIRRTLLAGPPWRQRQLLLDESSNPDGSVGEPMQRSFGPFRQVRMSVFTPVQEQLETLQTLDPTVIYGTPSGVKELCDHASSQQVRPQSVDVVFLSSELISDAVRRQIEAFFDCHVVGIYGSTEFKDLAHECEKGHYHSYFQSAILEVDADPDCVSGRLLITSLINKAMPLIRFDIGDHATIGVDPCPCGRGSPYLSNIIGREIEFLVLRDGRRLSPYRLTTAVETVPGLLKYRFIQTQDRSLSMEVVLAKNGRTEATQTSQIRESLRTILGNSVDVPIRVVEEIRRTRGGKHRIVSQSSTAD